MFGSLYQELKTDDKLSLGYNLVFVVRRINIAFVAIFLRNYPSQQLMLLMFQNTLCLIYIGLIRPFKGSFTNNIFILNEFVIGLTMIFQVIFTEFCSNVNTKFQVGWASLAFFGSTLFFNLSISFGKTIRKVFLFTKRLYTILWHKIIAYLEKREIENSNVILGEI